MSYHLAHFLQEQHLPLDIVQFIFEIVKAKEIEEAKINPVQYAVKYAYKNGSYPKELLSIVVKKILIPKWRDSVKIRPYIKHWIEDTAKTVYSKIDEVESMTIIHL